MTRTKPYWNLAIRLTGQMVRLIFLLIIVKYLDSEEYVEFGIAYSAIALCVLISGAEMHVALNRNIAKDRNQKIGKLLIDHLRLTSITLFIAALAITLYTHQNMFSHQMMIPILLGVEYLSQELSRILISLQKQLSASIAIFIRTASWVPISIQLISNPNAKEQLLLIYTPWLVGGIMSIIFAVCQITKFSKNQESVVQLNPQNAWRKYIAGIAFLSMAMINQGMVTADRIIIQDIMEIEAAAAYIFFMTVCSSISSIYVPFVVNMYQPRLIEEFETKTYQALYKEFFKKSIVLISLVSGVIYFSFDIFIVVAEKENFNDFREMFVYILIVNMVKNYGQISHIRAYVERRDWALRVGTWLPCLGLVIFWYLSLTMFSLGLLITGYILFYVGAIILKATIRI